MRRPRRLACGRERKLFVKVSKGKVVRLTVTQSLLGADHYCRFFTRIIEKGAMLVFENC